MSETTEELQPDSVMLRVGEGIALGQQRERESARQIFIELWSEIKGADGDAFHRVAIAHSMADVCDDVLEELDWDLRALKAADSVTDLRAAEGGLAGPASNLYPSLHLNLVDCYRRLGDTDRAREHLKLGQLSLELLPNSGYSGMIASAFDRLTLTLS